MSRQPLPRRALLLGLLSLPGLLLPLALGVSGLSGCADSDACHGRAETCLSLTLTGSDGISQVDQLEVMVQRLAKGQSPMVPLGDARPLPFKVAVLWPDGPGTVSVRSFLQGQLIGVTPELTLDLRNGSHDKRKLTLFPPLVGSPLGDLGSKMPDLGGPADMASKADLLPGADLSPGGDLSTPADLAPASDM